MLPWKRNRSRENNHEVESMETNKNSKLGSKNNFSRSFLGLSSRVFSGQFLSNVCNSFKTMTHPTNPFKVNIMTNSSSTSSQRLANPTKMLKRWVPNTELGLGLATSMTGDLELGLELGSGSGSGSASGQNRDNFYKTGKNVIHRSTNMMLFNDNILSHSSSKSNFEDDIGGKSMCHLTLGIEGPSDHHMVMNNSKTFTRLPSDQYDRNVDEVRHFQEENANGVVFFSPVASPKEGNIFPPNEFLKYCHFCKNELDHRKDIFMYRGENAFCSEECREEWIHFDAIRSKRKRSARQAAKGKPPRA